MFCNGAQRFCSPCSGVVLDGLVRDMEDLSGKTIVSLAQKLKLKLDVVVSSASTTGISSGDQLKYFFIKNMQWDTMFLQPMIRYCFWRAAPWHVIVPRKNVYQSRAEDRRQMDAVVSSDSAIGMNFDDYLKYFFWNPILRWDTVFSAVDASVLFSTACSATW